MRFPEIDYQAHPAYAPLRSDVRYDDLFIEERIRAIDATSAQFCADVAPDEPAFAEALAGIRRDLDRILSHARESGIGALANEWLHTCVRWTIADFAYEFSRRIFSRREYRAASLSQPQVKQLETIRSRGLYVADLPPRAYAEVRRLATHHLDELKTRAIAAPHLRAVTNVAFNSPLWKAIKRAVEEAGVIGVLSEFKRNEMTLLGAGLEYSHPGQRWYQNLYSDAELGPGPFQYLHYDEGDCVPKSMIYVTPVGEDSGPTRAIPESNCWEASECKIRMHRALDRIIGDRYREVSVDGDYRILARQSDLRRVFMGLPRAFRGSSHFGDDILPDSSLAAALKPLEVPYLSEGAQTMVFDGPHLLHRGSLVKSGERLSLQVVYRNRNEARIRSKLVRESLLSEQYALWRKYARRFVMEHA